MTRDVIIIQDWSAMLTHTKSFWKLLDPFQANNFSVVLLNFSTVKPKCVTDFFKRKRSQLQQMYSFTLPLDSEMMLANCTSKCDFEMNEIITRS